MDCEIQPHAVEMDPPPTAIPRLAAIGARAVAKHHQVVHQEYQHRAGLKSDTAVDLIERVKRLEAGQPPPATTGVLADFISEAALADQLDVGIRTLREWRRLGKGPAPTLVSRKLYYRAKSIQDWLLSREKKAPRERAGRRSVVDRATV